MTRRYPMIKIKNGERHYRKLTVSQKNQHYILMTTFLLLVFTGFPLKFHYYDWAEPTIRLFGGLASTRLIHRVAGVIMVGLFFYHWYYLFKNLFRLYIIPAKKTSNFSIKEMIQFIYYSPTFPRLKDIKDFLDFVKFALFITDQRPKHERFYWREKFDYWAVFWGIPVLGLTGLFLWFPEETAMFLPGWAVNIGYIAHSDEAMLAVSVIFVWHMYNAHVNYDKFPASPLFITGYLPEHIMKHEYYLEWERMNCIAEKDPSQIVDLDKMKEAEQFTNEQKVKMVRDQIEFLKSKQFGSDE
ncbi:formate dehydrogenase subunit gamma [Limisalsivibrio acetivorans]|uniref:formate dehydrogenase subunit gamma n=1 Tax=Limisalsivibrio acetivorans TaxID=1304888 RepID=UPI0003B3B526|nr:cytochrome b/b6 domain-containing protein [Limisalsivibrio acetivorans]